MRNPKEHEILLIEFLINQANISANLNDLMALDMEDGGMGSIKLIEEDSKRKCGKLVSDCQFIDADKTPVIVSLFLDDIGQLYELDIWKVDFSPTIKFPTDINELTLLS